MLRLFWFLLPCWQWLLPSEAGYLEAEGLEDTRHFSQEAIVKEVDVTSARKAFDLQLPGFYFYIFPLSIESLDLSKKHNILEPILGLPLGLISSLMSHVYSFSDII